METWKLCKAFQFIMAYPRKTGLMPIKYNYSTKRFETETDKLYLVYYYPRLAFALARNIILVWSLSSEIFVQKSFIISEGTSVVRLFYYLPISIFSIVNLSTVAYKKDEIASTLNTFLVFYDRFQS